MRIYFIVIGIFLTLIQSKAQDKTIFGDKLFSFGVNEGIKTFSGNNFISKSYKTSASTSFDIRFKVYENWGIGGGGEFSSPSIKTIQYVGNSTKAKMSSWFGYVFYKINVGEKWLFVPKIGIYSYSLTNTLESNDFYSTYDYRTKGNAYFVAPEINYFLTKHISANANIQYSYIKLHDMNANEEAIGISYQKSNQFLTSVGIRFWF
ncbi:MAG: hypothetical protein DI598_01985 [Pseudopedobacter saltans]|uniref:Outer membrane protein beta-barrel domain-containing protein n=1 Tax=Pseudopedobacter saltans TaxID=151895 RepID=A0A2W5FAH9_9SPHI|nr:MAG: hypothetical protein DI598_01985 [Pseudopedobacter saltans]